MKKLSTYLTATVALCLFAFTAVAHANTIHFVPTQTGANLVVQVQGQSGSDSAQCIIHFSQSECVVSNFPNKTKALVTVWQRPGTTGSDPRELYGKVAFWVKLNTLSSAGDLYVSIPVGSAHFTFSQTPANHSSIFIMPEQYLQYAMSYGTPQNSGATGYNGQEVGQVGGTCSYTGCTKPLLAGCYSVVFRVGTAGAITVNSASQSSPNEIALCIEGNDTTDYQIDVP